MSEQFYTVEQAATRLGLHPKTVLRFIHDARLRARRIGKSYRILHSDLENFAGNTGGAVTAAIQARVTCIVEIAGIEAATCQRITNFLNAAISTGEARSDPVQFTTAYDPLNMNLKLVVIGSAPDAAALLHLTHLQIESLK
jgi:excisionase family DNA binding protein